MSKFYTVESIKRLKPKICNRKFKRDGEPNPDYGKPERTEYPDAGAPGLRIVVQPSGAKSWAMRFRGPDRKPDKPTLGPVDLSGHELAGEPTFGAPLTIPAARKLANEVHRQRALGRDVVADRKADKHRRRAETEENAENTFAALARKFCDTYKTKRHKTRPRRMGETARHLGFKYPRGGGEPTLAKNGLAERWKDKAVRDIDGHDMWAVVSEAREKGLPGIERRNNDPSDARARALYASLSSMFSWLVRNRVIAANPCAEVERPDAPPDRDRVLTTPELRWFWTACDEVDAPRVLEAPRPFGAVLRLLLLTGQRLNEVAGLRGDELSEDRTTWTIPGDRTKNHRTHIVPLPPLAREIIAGATSRRGEFVFSTTGKSPISGFSKCKVRLDAAMLRIAREEAEAAGRDPAEVAIPGWRLHDLRRSAATGMAEMGIAPHIVEAIINHVSGHKGGVAGIYNRAEYAKEKRAALERWANHVAGLVSDRPPNVVALREKGRSR